ncbi:MAG TPA: hypothetical protein PKY59_12600 [Pyrinomonadaceae bacterium]|nr:hypothetical protein [Pyrinomonadaceae bacterium]
MGRRSQVDGLEADEFDFVIRQLVDGATDREVSAAFFKQFEKELPKSNLNSWRNKAGKELIERFKLTRFLGKQLVEGLKDEGKITNENDYQIIIKSVEEHLLAAAQKFTKQNPLKLLTARQEEERIQLQREKIELAKSQLEFEREKHRNAIDREKVSAEVIQDFMEYGNGDAEIVALLTRHLRPFGEFVKNKYAAQK